MTAKVKPIPDGYHTVTPYLVIKKRARAHCAPKRTRIRVLIQQEVAP